ncbi:MAG TPA: TAXI family TRAP transporter solute-binding subunit [Gammaproteobacteria bacterium]|jgi:TRAP transporter TAXI family solute receptor|nr:TAXI family TRAP transporter solute-binding subunit [Gammaproteobacteria bacterium]
MKFTKLISTVVGFIAIAIASNSQADLYRVTSIAPGMSPFVVNTAIAKIVGKHVPGVDMQVRATGAATRHIVEAAQGKVDFLFSSSIINLLMMKNLGPYKNMENAPELEKNIGMIFSYQIGPYHYITRADSGIEKLEDIAGRKIFAGPPGGAAKRVCLGNIKDASGLVGGKDFEAVDFGFDAAIQAFQDDKIDVIVLSTNVPSSSVSQFALTKKIRLIDIDVTKLKINPLIGRTINVIAPDAYGDNQVNTSPVRTHGALVNFSARMDLDEEVVYQVTKAIWEHVDELHEAAAWMKDTVSLENALELIPMRLHPGAERYYREIGMAIPEPATY